MVQEICDGDGGAEIGQLRQVLLDVVGEAQLPGLRQQHNLERREGLGDRRQLEAGLRGHRNVMLQVGETVGAFEDGPTPADQDDRASRGAGLAPLRKQGIDASGECIAPLREVLSRKRAGHAGAQDEQDDDKAVHVALRNCTVLLAHGRRTPGQRRAACPPPVAASPAF